MIASRIRCCLAAIFVLLVASAAGGIAGASQPENLARLAKASASSIWQDSPDMAPSKAIDGDMQTRWGGKARGEWFELEWTAPVTITGIVLHNYNESWNKGIPFTLQAWDTNLNNNAGGFKEIATLTPNTARVVFEFEPVITTRIRVNNVITFWEIEVYRDPEATKEIVRKMNSVDIAVAGDLLGHLIGTVSYDQGSTPIADAEVEVTGSTPLGRWKQTVKSGENGFFEVDLPLGSTGPVKIRASRDGLTGALSLDSSDIAKRLTPRPNKMRISLDGRWDFAVDPGMDGDEKWSKIDVPSHWEMQGFTSESGKGLYKRSFTIPDSWAGKRVKFRAESIYNKAEVWINSRRVGSHTGGATPFELDITDAVKPGVENEIRVLVSFAEDIGHLDHMSFYAYFNLTGIWRPLEVFAVEPAHISRLTLHTDFDEQYKDADLIVDLDIANEQNAPVKDASLALTVTDPTGKAVRLDGLSTTVSLGPWEQKSVRLKARVVSPAQWSQEDPRLYKLKAALSGASPIEQRFGFKEVEIKGRSYLVNGKPVRFWGTCHHDAHPLLGRAVTPEILRQDFELMKGSNLTAIRTSHYPPHPLLLDLADEMGFYVQDECGFGWVGWTGGIDANNLRYAPYVIASEMEMVERDRNHPSVSIWSICNESGWGRIFDMGWAHVRKSDPTRPCSAGQSANLEIATYHNPTSMQRMKDTQDFKMPVLFDEGMANFHGWGMGDMLELDPGLHDMWVTPHFEPLNHMIGSEHQFGLMIWAWVDDAFLVPGQGVRYWRSNHPKIHQGDRIYKMPGRGIVGDYVWGTVDGWRRPKPEWWLSKKLFSPIQIEEKPLMIPKDGETIRVPVTNRKFFIDLNSYRCKWQLGSEKGEIKADVKPQSTGEIRIPIKRKPSADDTLVLEFFDRSGTMVDGYKLAFKARDIPKLPKSGKPARIIDEPNTEFLSMNHPVRMVGRNMELTYDRASGGLERGITGKELVLADGPRLHILKNSYTPENIAVGWTLKESTFETRDGQAVLNWKGEYTGGITGGYQIRMDDSGCVEIDYSFKYNGPEVTAREIGLSFDLPLDFDRLEWDRRAEWSYYPDDHIGRPHGVALAHPDVSQSVPPGDRPYNLDDHPWGCNDFRSTKRNIYWAALTDGAECGIKVFSDGSQHIRATVGVHTISLKVMDYYGGSASGINEYDGAYGAGRVIMSGDEIKGTVRLQPVCEGARVQR